VDYTVVLSFLKREGEHFRLFVQRRYCVPTRTFLGVPDGSALQPFTVPGHLHERSMNVFDPCHETLDVQGRSRKVKDVGWSGT
jgi:hypothetical protein